MRCLRTKRVRKNKKIWTETKKTPNYPIIRIFISHKETFRSRRSFFCLSVLHTPEVEKQTRVQPLDPIDCFFDAAATSKSQKSEHLVLLINFSTRFWTTFQRIWMHRTYKTEQKFDTETKNKTRRKRKSRLKHIFQTICDVKNGQAKTVFFLVLKVKNMFPIHVRNVKKEESAKKKLKSTCAVHNSGMKIWLWSEWIFCNSRGVGFCFSFVDIQHASPFRRCWYAIG